MGKVVKGVFQAAAFIGGFLGGGPPGAALALLGARTITSQFGRRKQADPIDISIRTQLIRDPGAPRYAVFGETAAPVIMRYFESYGTDGKTASIVIAHAGHRITEFRALYLNGEAVQFDGDTPIGTSKWVPVLSRQKVFGTSDQAAMSINGGARWTSAHRMRGVTGQTLTFDFEGHEDLAENGLPQQIVQVIKAMPVYDPRLDSTNGGVGSHRPDDNSTWQYANSGTDIGRNPVLQELTYRLGWYENGHLVVGRGQGVDTIDLASYAAAASVCEELIGGKPRYLSDGVLDLANDDHDSNTAKILAACGGVIVDKGGITGIRVAHNDTASVALTLTDSDIVGDGFTWEPKPGIDSRRNTARGQYVDPDKLYQLADYPEIAPADLLAADDGLQLVDTLNFSMVQDQQQARRLAEIAMRESRQGTLAFNMIYKGIQVDVGDIVAINHPTWGWVNKTFRVDTWGLGAIDTTPVIKLVARAVDATDYLEPSTAIKPTPPDVPTEGFNLAQTAFLRPASDTLNLEVDVRLDGGFNPGEAILYGFNGQGQPDRSVDGHIFWDGSKIAIPRQIPGTLESVATAIGARKGFICLETSGGNPFTVQGQPVSVAFVWRWPNGQWQYDNNAEAVNFIPSATMVAIGWLQTGAPDRIVASGLFGAPVTLTLAAFPAATENTGDLADLDQVNTAEIVDLAASEIHVATSGNVSHSGTDFTVIDIAVDKKISNSVIILLATMPATYILSSGTNFYYTRLQKVSPLTTYQAITVTGRSYRPALTYAGVDSAPGTGNRTYRVHVERDGAGTSFLTYINPIIQAIEAKR